MPAPYAPQDLETVACPVCGAAETRTLVPGPGWSMGRCRGCGLIRQNPRVTAEALRRLEYDVRRVGVPTPRRATGLETEGLEAWESDPQEAFLGGVEAVEAVEARRPAGAPRGLWLDVGCQTGGMLLAARSRGWAVAGADLDGASTAFCRSHHGLDARSGSLVEAGFPSAAASVVSYRQVLEHVHDLAGELAEVRRVLAPDGRLLVEVPHGSGMRLLIDRVRIALRFMPRSGLFRNVPQHLYYFDAGTLARLLSAAGFEVLSAVTYGRWRRRRGPVRRAYEALRDRWRVGNKLRVVARRVSSG